MAEAEKDTREMRPGMMQIGHIKPGNLASWDSNGRIEDAGISIRELRELLDEHERAKRKK